MQGKARFRMVLGTKDGVAQGASVNRERLSRKTQGESEAALRELVPIWHFHLRSIARGAILPFDGQRLIIVQAVRGLFRCLVTRRPKLAKTSERLARNADSESASL
jgi:hypothetical protein